VSNRRRLVTAIDDGVDVSMVSMLSTVTANFGSTFETVDEISAANVLRSIAVVVTIGLLGLFAVIGVFMGFRMDSADHLTLHPGAAKGKQNRVAAKTENRKKTIVDQIRRQKRNLTLEEEFIENSLPDAMKSQALSERLAREMKDSHKWIGVIFHYSPHFPRPLRVLMLVTSVFTMLFMQALIYPIAHPDDGTCYGYKPEDECLSASSGLGGGNKCRYSIEEDSGRGYCEFNPPGDHLQTVIFMAIIAAVLATPLHLIADGIVLKVLIAPVVSNKVGDSAAPVDTVAEAVAARCKDGEASDPRGNHQNTALSAAAPVAETEHRRPSASQRQRGSVSGLSHISLASVFGGNLEVLDSTLNEDVTNLMREIAVHRQVRLSKEFQRAEFDSVWGLDGESGQFRGDSEALTMLDRLSGKKGDVHSFVLADLAEVRKSAAREIEYMSAPNVTKAEKGQRLIRLFQQDMMPGLSGKVLETTSADDKFAKTPPRPYSQRILGWIVIIGMDTVMLFYILLFSIQQSNEQQDAWLKSFLVYIFMDIVFVATMMVCVKKVVIPSFAMRDLHKIREQMLKTIKCGLKGGLETDETLGFNATDYLYVATRVAKKFPRLKESRIIQSFKTPWPKRSYQRVQVVTKAYGSKFKSLAGSFTTVAVFLLSMYVELPISAQDMCLQSTALSVFGSCAVAFSALYEISPFVAIAPFIVVAVLVHFILLWAGARSAEQMQRVRKPTRTGIDYVPTAVTAPGTKLTAPVTPQMAAVGGPRTHKDSVLLGKGTLQKLHALRPDNGHSGQNHGVVGSRPRHSNHGGNGSRDSDSGSGAESVCAEDRFEDVEAWITELKEEAEKSLAESAPAVLLSRPLVYCSEDEEEEQYSYNSANAGSDSDGYEDESYGGSSEGAVAGAGAGTGDDCVEVCVGGNSVDKTCTGTNAQASPVVSAPSRHFSSPPPSSSSSCNSSSGPSSSSSSSSSFSGIDSDSDSGIDSNSGIDSDSDSDSDNEGSLSDESIKSCLSDFSMNFGHGDGDGDGDSDSDSDSIEQDLNIILELSVDERDGDDDGGGVVLMSRSSESEAESGSESEAESGSESELSSVVVSSC